MALAATVSVKIASADASASITVPDAFNGETPKAAIVIGTYGSGATATGKWNDAILSYGLIDGSSQIAMSAGSYNNQAIGTANRKYYTGSVVLCNYWLDVDLIEYTGALIADGIQFTKVTNTGNDLHLLVLLIGGDDVQANLKMSETGTGPVQNIGFEPNCLIAGTIGRPNGNENNDAMLSMGIVVENSQGTEERAMTYFEDVGPASTELSALSSDTGFLGSIANNALDWGFSHTSFGAGNGGEHNYSGNAGTDTWFGLYLRFENDDFGLISRTLPATPQLFGASSHFEPSAHWFAVMHDVTAWSNTPKNTSVAGFTHGMVDIIDTGSKGSISIASRDNVPTSVVRRQVNRPSWTGMGDTTAQGFTGSALASFGGGQAFFFNMTATDGTQAVAFIFSVGSKSRAIVQYGAPDVDAIKYGANDVDKVYYGGTEI